MMTATRLYEGMLELAELPQLPNFWHSIVRDTVHDIVRDTSAMKQLTTLACRMTAEVYERERSRMQLGPQRLEPSSWASTRQAAAPPGTSNLPSIAFRTPPSQPAAVQRSSEVASGTRSRVSPASGALRSLARKHALPGVLRFGGNVRPPHDWRLLMKVCAARVSVGPGINGAGSSFCIDVDT